MSSTYAQPGPKRQRVKETRASESLDYFQGIEKVEYSTMAGATESAAYRYYNSSERINGRTMEEWLKYSVSMTDFRSDGSDWRGRGTYQRTWDDHTNGLDNHKRCIKACFDFCCKLGIKYWTAFDSDLLPSGASWDECRTHWDEIADYIHENVLRTHVKPLWIAPDLHTVPRYAAGAMTNPDASIFMHAASQVKKCLEISQRLNCECFLLWPYREGYDAIFKSDIAREIKLFAKLLKITADYKEKLNYRCQMLLMPYYNNASYNFTSFGGVWKDYDRINRYMWDVTSCLFFLKNYNLDRYYKVCVPPGHQMYMANIYNMLGGVAVTDEWTKFDTRALTLMMKCIVDQGTCPLGGINLMLTPRRSSTDLRDLVTAYVKYIDAIAKGLKIACNVISEQIFSKHVQQRYASYQSGPGGRLISGDITMEECEDYYKKNQHQMNETMTSSRSEHLDILLQRHLDSADQM